MNIQQQDETLLISQDEAARLLNVDRTTIWRMWKRGDLVTVTIGSRRQVRRDSLDAYIESNSERR